MLTGWLPPSAKDWQHFTTTMSKPIPEMKSTLTILATITLGCSTAFGRKAPASENDLIPPSVPLVACDPYFSVWSPGDKLTDVETTHWTGKLHPLTSLVKVDGKAFRVLGKSPDSIAAFPQTGVTVLPTRTICTFEGEGVALDLIFTTPALPDDIDLLSRPVTYLTYSFRSTDGREHAVSVYFGASGNLAVNTPDQRVTWGDAGTADLAALKIGSQDQSVLGRSGDDLRIEWGYLYVSAPKASTAATGFGQSVLLANAFADSGLKSARPAAGDAARADQLAAGIELKPLKVGKDVTSTWLMVAYDDLYSIQYNHQNLRPYWRRNGWEAKDLLSASARDYSSLLKRCAAFDQELVADMKALGGEKYAKITALAYRQCFAAGKFVADEKGQPLEFCKENHSNGCIATSDVFYPMSPQFLLFGPSVAKSFIVPFMNYAKSDRWKFPFAPHDLGTYPLANGQVYGGGEKTEDNQMPVEESGNLLLLMGAVAQMEGNANFAGLYWSRLEQWAAYLKEKGFDPENQLCTDDFAGHLAHNVNLSAKAICGLGAFAKLCEMRGDKVRAKEYQDTAQAYARRWVEEGKDGDHYRLAFDRTGTWSQKYNLIWDRILGLNLFPDEVLRTEMEFYKKSQNVYGLPLDNRRTYTKLDWTLWTATLTQDSKDFEALSAPVFRFLNETPDRSPMTDWYETLSGKKVGFTARSVVGGVFARALYDKKIWSKYAGRDRTKAANWAPLPDYVPPVVKTLVPNAAEKADIEWRYTTSVPAAGWSESRFDDSTWKLGQGGFGTRETPNTKVRTEWNSPDIWMRREIEMPAVDLSRVTLMVRHDEDIEIFINGVQAAKASGFNDDYAALTLTPQGRAALKPGRNVIALHCHQSIGGQYVDLGFVEVIPSRRK